MKLAISLAAFFCSLALHAGVAGKRYLVAHIDNTPAFEVTQHHVDRGTSTTVTFIIDDSTGPLMQVDLTMNYAARKTIARYELLRGRRGNVTVVLDLPYASTTREERVQEIRTRPELLTAPIPVTITSSSGRSVRALDADWRAPETRNTHLGRARDVVGEEMLAAMVRVSELGGLVPFVELRQMLGYVLDDEQLVSIARNLKVAEVDLGCEFDERGGVRCTK